MKRFLQLLTVACLITVGFWATRKPEWRQHFAESPTLTLYSLEPEQEYWPRNTRKDARKMDDSLILGSAIISDASEKARLLTAIDKRSGNRAGCVFSPRHALESADKSIRLVACFECGQGNVAGQSFPSENSPSLSFTAAPVFNAILKKHGVPLSHMGKQGMK